MAALAARQRLQWLLLETAAARGSSVAAARHGGETAELRGDGELAAAAVVACCCSAAAANAVVLQNHGRSSMQQRRCADGGASQRPLHGGATLASSGSLQLASTTVNGRRCGTLGYSFLTTRKGLYWGGPSKKPPGLAPRTSEQEPGCR